MTQLAKTNIHLMMDTDGVVTTTTTEVAEVFGRRHDNIIRAIENIECSDNFNGLNFEPVDYLDKKGEVRKRYNLTKDGFVFLAMGFNGKKAASFKEAYINEFNRMEATLKNENKEIELGRTRLCDDTWITTHEIATLFNFDVDDVLKMSTGLRDLISIQPHLVGVRVDTTPEDTNNFYLNLPAFLMLDLGDSLQVAKQKFRVVSAFHYDQNKHYITEDEKAEEDRQEAKQEILDWKKSADVCDQLSMALIEDMEWKSNPTNKIKGNTIDVVIDLLGNLSDKKSANIKSLLKNQQQYEEYINNTILERLSRLLVHLHSLNFKSIASRLNEALKQLELERVLIPHPPLDEI